MIIDLLKKSVPEYKLKLTDMGKTLPFRPMLVKEEKFISIVTNVSSSFEDKIKNLCLIIDSCFNNKIKSIDLSLNDFQLALNSIRKKSISESVNFKMTCPFTQEMVNVNLNLDSFSVTNLEKKIELNVNDKFIYTFVKPRIKDLIQLEDFPKSTEDWKKIAVNCLTTIESKEEKIDVLSEKIEEKNNYINFMKTQDFKTAVNFIKSNAVSFKINYVTSDGEEREIEVNDISNFLKFFMVILTL